MHYNTTFDVALTYNNSYDYNYALDSDIVTDAELDGDIPLRGIYNCTFTYDIRLVLDYNYLYNTNISNVIAYKANIISNNLYDSIIAYISNYNMTDT